MKYILIITSLLFTLSACTWGGTPTPPKESPYPSTPLSLSGETMTPPVTKESKGEKYSAKGTEPFWNAEIDASSVIFTRPGKKDVITKKYDTTQVDKGSIINIKDTKGEFFITLIKGSCSDGMSETKYSHKATVFVGAETLTGCAMKK